MIDVIMCLRNPDISVLDLVVRRIRQQSEVNRIIFVASIKGELNPFVDWADNGLRHGDSIVHEDTSLSFARRLGIYASKTKLISFVDCDVLIPSNFYKKCLFFLDRFSCVGAVNPISIDTEWSKYGIKPRKRQIEILQRGLCTATLMRRELVADWDPPVQLEALEDFHLTQHVANKGKLWIQIPHYVIHLSFGEDTCKRWLWNAAGVRLIQQMGLGHKLPFTYQAPSTFKYILWRVARILAIPIFFHKYGTNARAIIYAVSYQYNLLKGYLKASKYLETRRTGHERLETD